MEFISTIRKSLPCFCYSYPSDPEAEDSRGQGKRVRSFPEHHGKPGRLHDPDVYPCIMRSPPRRPGTAVAVHARSQLPGHFQRTAVGMSTTCCYTPGDLDIFTPVNARNRTWIGVCREAYLNGCRSLMQYRPEPIVWTERVAAMAREWRQATRGARACGVGSHGLPHWLWLMDSKCSVCSRSSANLSTSKIRL
jgi:hypothetical protein